MNWKHMMKMVHESEYVAEVDIELIESEDELAPYLSVQDAEKLDSVRDALRRGDVRAASKFGRVFRLTPVTG